MSSVGSRFGSSGLKGIKGAAVTYKRFQHLHRDDVKKMLKMEKDNTYVVIGTKGSVGVLDCDHQITTNYDLDLENKAKCVTLGKRHDSWRHLVTDVVEMSDCHFYVVATSRSSLHFLDVSDETHLEGYRLLELPNTPLCLDYSHDDAQKTKGSVLCYGDSGDHVCVLKFHQPKTGLFEGKRLAGVEQVLFRDLRSAHIRCVRFNRMCRRHTNGVKCVKYVARNQTVISCSVDDPSALLIQQVQNKLPVYNIQLKGGIYDFDYDDNRRIIATCGRDCVARLWNVTTCLIGCLYGHTTPIMAIRFHLGGVVTLAVGQEVRFWDVMSENCVCQVFLHFPRRFPSHVKERHSPHPFTHDGENIWVISGSHAACITLHGIKTSSTKDIITEYGGNSTSSQNTLFPIKWSLSTEFVASTCSAISDDVHVTPPSFQETLITSKQRAAARLKASVRRNRPYTALPTHPISKDWKIRIAAVSVCDSIP